MTLNSTKIAVPLVAAMVLSAGGYFVYRAASAPSAAIPPQAKVGEAAKPLLLSAELRGRLLMCKDKRFARIAPNADFAWASKELDGYDFIIRHCVSPDGKSVAFKHQTITGEVLSLWKFDQRWPGKVIWARRELIREFFWMPDGKQLVLCKAQAFKNDMPADFQFQTLDVATRKLTELKMPDGHWLADVSPDGKWFLTMTQTDRKTEAQVHRVERSSGKAHKLFDGGFLTLPRWKISPDGRRVAGMKLVGPHTAQIFVGDVKERMLRQVTKEDHPVFLYGWSPDGRKLLYNFTRQPAQPKAGAAYHQILAAIDADGNNRIEILDNAAHYNDQGQMRVEDLIGWVDWR